MTEKKDPLQEILTAIDNRLKKLESPPEHSHSTEKPTSSKPPHVHSPNVAFDCPDCQKAYDEEVVAKATPQILADRRAKIKSMKNPNLCEDCGEIFDGEEEDDCPTCHGKTEE